MGPTYFDNFIGRELFDPSDSLGRHADANFVAFDTARGSRGGIPYELARPELRAVLGPREVGNRVITIDPFNPFISITDTMLVLYPEMEVDKIGRTTGWTSGKVIDDCEDSDQLGKCLQSAWLAAEWGDSGGPVFVFDEDGDNGRGAAKLAGILVGGEFVDDQWTGKVFFSNLRTIQLDLGDLIVLRVCGPLVCID